MFTVFTAMDLSRPQVLLICAFVVSNIVFITWIVIHLSIPTIGRTTGKIGGPGLVFLVLSLLFVLAALLLTIIWVKLKSTEFDAEETTGKFLFLSISLNVVSTLIQKPDLQQIVLSCPTFFTHRNAFHIAWVFAVVHSRKKNKYWCIALLLNNFKNCFLDTISDKNGKSSCVSPWESKGCGFDHLHSLSTRQ